MIPREFYEEVKKCKVCTIRQSCKAPVIGYGNKDARLIVVGEAPGFAEDCTGIPATGINELLDSKCVTCKHLRDCFKWFLEGKRNSTGHVMCLGYAAGNIDPDILSFDRLRATGQILDDIVEALGLSRQDDMYVMNIVMCRPTVLSDNENVENRIPSNSEILNCIPLFMKHIGYLSPKCVLAMGGTACRALIPGFSRISISHGKIVNSNMLKSIGMNVPIVPTYHPSFLLRASQGSDAYREIYDILVGDMHKAAKIASISLDLV